MHHLVSKKAVVSGVGVLLFFLSVYYIYHQFRWVQIYRILLQADIIFLVVGSSITIFLFWFFRAARWMVLLRMQGYKKVPFGRLYFAISCSLALAVVTPLQSGELLKVELLKKHYRDLSRGDGYISFGIERLLDILVIIVITVIGLLFGNAGQISWSSIVGFVIALSLLLVMLYMLALKFKAHSSILSSVAIQFQCLLMSRSTLLASVGLTVCAWLSISGGWWLVLFSIDITLPLFDVLGLTSGMTLVNVASLVPGGVGVSEAGVSIWLVALEVSPDQASAAALLTRFYGLLAALLGLLYFCAAKLLGTNMD